MESNISEASYMSDWCEEDFWVKKSIREHLSNNHSLVEIYNFAISKNSWVPSSGPMISVQKMDDKWLLNSIRMLKDKRKAFNCGIEKNRDRLIRMLESEKDRRGISYRINKGRGITKERKDTK